MPDEKYHNGPNFDFATWIGMVASGWATLEFAIDAAIWSLAGLEPYKGACITAQLPNVSRRLYAWSSLIDQQNPSANTRRRINKFIESTNRLSRRRNRIVHDPWAHKGSHEKGETFRLEIVSDVRLSVKTVPGDRQEMHDIALEIEKQRAGFSVLCGEIDRELGTRMQNRFALPEHGPENLDDHA